MQLVHSIKKANEKIANLKRSTHRAREKAGELMENVIHTSESVGAAFGFGYLEGSIADPEHFELAGMPLPLVVGTGAKLFALLGIGRGMDSHLNALGTGALAAHFNGIGRKLGAQKRKGFDTDTYPVRGELSGGQRPRRGAGVTESELRSMVEAAR